MPSGSTTPAASKEANLAAAREHDAFRFVEADLADVDLPPLLDGVEAVFHLAAQPGVRTSWEREFETYVHDNILATQRLLEACRTVRPRRVVYASSSSIYGNAAVLPVDEDTCGQPVSPYGVSKLAGEQLCHLSLPDAGCHLREGARERPRDLDGGPHRDRGQGHRRA